MRLLFIQKSAGRGGAKSSLLETLAVLSGESRHQVQVLVGENGPLVELCRTLDVTVVRASLPEWRKWIDRLRFGGTMRRLAARLAAESFDCIISNEMWWAPHAARLAAHLGCRSAVILRDGIATLEKARKYRLRDNDRILPVSSTITRQLTPDPALKSKLRTVYDSIRLPANQEGGPEALRQRLSACPSVLQWLAVVGKIGPRKNQIETVKVLDCLVRAGLSECGLVLAGDGDAQYLSALCAEVKRRQLEPRVICLGNWNDIASLCEAAAAVLLTSTREGLPRSLVEALLAQRPAFTYRCEGVEDIFAEQVDHFVAQENSPEALAELIHKGWQNQPAMRAALARVSRRARDQFSPQNHRAQLESALAMSALR